MLHLVSLISSNTGNVIKEVPFNSAHPQGLRPGSPALLKVKQLSRGAQNRCGSVRFTQKTSPHLRIHRRRHDHEAQAIAQISQLAQHGEDKIRFESAFVHLIHDNGVDAGQFGVTEQAAQKNTRRCELNSVASAVLTANRKTHALARQIRQTVRRSASRHTPGLRDHDPAGHQVRHRRRNHRRLTRAGRCLDNRTQRPRRTAFRQAGDKRSRRKSTANGLEVENTHPSRLRGMRIVRFVHNDEPTYGVLEGDVPEPADDGTFDTSGLEIAVLSGDPFFSPAGSTGERLPYADVRLIAPIIPRSKIIAVGRNYADHARELGNEVPASPQFFFIPNTAIVGPNEPVRLPAVSEEVSYEAELAVIISRVAKQVRREDALKHVLGYTVANDVTLRDLQKTDLQWARAKGFDTSTPVGPWIETELDTEDLRVRSWVDGELRQDGTTADMVFDIPALIEAISETITLLPGDIILTGTPAGVGKVEAGQRMNIAVEGLGLLSNPAMDA